MAVMNQEQIWSVVQEELRFQLAKPSYETWLKNTSLVSADGNTFRIGVPSKLAKDWLEDRFAGLIQETLQAVTGGEVDVDFVVAPTGNGQRLPSHDEGERSDELPEEAGQVLVSELNEKFKFSSFVVGNNILNASLVSVGQLGAGSGTGAGISAGVSFIDQLAYRTSSTDATGPGVVQKLDLKLGTGFRPTRMIESPLFTAPLATTTTNQSTTTPTQSADSFA